LIKDNIFIEQYFQVTAFLKYHEAGRQLLPDQREVEK
jgi:hypothetical protein